MGVATTSEEDLLRRLPLPLAQLYRRARNGKTPVDRHHNAYYLAEATLKLAASARIGEALHAGLDHQSPLARSLEQLCLPSVGHWVGFLRESSDYLRARPDAALLTLASTHEALTRHEALPAVREFAERASRGVDDEQPPIAPEAASQASRRGIMGFFELVAGYRNQVFGHGAQRPPAFYDELGGLLLAASAEVLRSEALFGGLTLAVARLTSGDSARSLRVEWQGLQGFASLMLAADVLGPEPDPSEEAARQAAGRVYLVARGVRVPLHPLVVYREDRSERERVGFLNRTVEASRSVRGGEVRRCDYLDYATGDLIQEVDARRELTELLARLRGRPATASDVDRVILESQAGSGETAPLSVLGAGAIIGDFVLEGELGRGGMGVVYRARQRSLNRTVALKVLPPSMAADPVSLGRFRREIAALARCEHPNLVKILTSGADGDRHYYAMELVEGMDLAALFEVLAAWNRSARGRLREGHLPAAVSTSSDMARRRQESQATDAEPLPDLEPVAPAPMPTLDSGRTLFEALGALFADAADALAHLHSRGVIHRDVKPANLMLTLDGRRLVLMDLGLAQLRDRSQSLTAADVKFVGTLRYTSPEQLQRNLLEVDERTDVYGLGATLYEMATLAPIFDGDTQPRLIEQVLHQEPRTPRAIEPAIPKDLAAIALHCLDKDRSQRYANAWDLAEDLRHFAKGEPVSVREPGPVERALKWARRKPTLAAAYVLGLLAVLLGGLGGVAAWQWRAAVRARGAAETSFANELDVRRKLNDSERERRRERARSAKEKAMNQLPDLRKKALWSAALVLLSNSRGDQDLDRASGDELAAAERDIRLLATLDDIRMRKASLAADRPQDVWRAESIQDEYRGAFERAGLDFYGGDPPEKIISEAAGKLREWAIGDDVLGYLDDWAWLIRGDESNLIWEATARVTGDRWRTSLRLASVSATESLRLGREVPASRLTPAIVCGMGVSLRLVLSDDRRYPARWLEGGARQHPSDFWVNFYLGVEYLRLGEPGPAAGAFRAAVAVRPGAQLARKCLDDCLTAPDGPRRGTIRLKPRPDDPSVAAWPFREGLPPIAAIR